jgi:hypothetical protein
VVELGEDMIDKQPDEDITRANKVTYTTKQMGDACERNLEHMSSISV